MSEKPYNSQELDDIRKKIDALDDRIHDTLMERAELVLKIGEEKRKKNIQVVQPAREARMIRRLLTRHKGVLPQMAVVRIWRELVGAVSLLQTGLKVAVSAPEAKADYWDLARDYFGSCLPMQKFGSPLSAISAVREGKSTFAVVPWPENEETQPWWVYLGDNAQETLNIIIRLPHGDDPASQHPDERALVVSKAGFDDSGDDRSFLLIQCNQKVSRGRIVDVAKKLGMEALSLASSRTTMVEQPCFHLVEVNTYLNNADPRVAKFADTLEDDYARVTAVGGYPVPPIYSRNIEPNKSSDSTLKGPPADKAKKASA
jgi:chorismate mutase-like protein